MLIFQKLIPRGQGLASVLLKRAASIELDWAARQQHEFTTTDGTSHPLEVRLPHGTLLRSGDVLVAQDGTLLVVKAAPQPVLEVRHCEAHGSPFDLVRAAYHLGSHHVPLALAPDHLTLAPDAEMARMLAGLHLIVTQATAPFEPESSAPAGNPHDTHPHSHAHGHAHSHDHDHSHDHSHGHAHPHEHSHDHPHPHAHGHTHEHTHGNTPTPAPARGKPLGIAITAAPVPHVHGPGCGHDHGSHA